MDWVTRMKAEVGMRKSESAEFGLGIERAKAGEQRAWRKNSQNMTADAVNMNLEVGMRKWETVEFGIWILNFEYRKFQGY
jgi:hypothetical protein